MPYTQITPITHTKTQEKSSLPLRHLNEIAQVAIDTNTTMVFLPINKKALKWLDIGAATKPFGVYLKTSIDGPAPGLILKPTEIDNKKIQHPNTYFSPLKLSKKHLENPEVKALFSSTKYQLTPQPDNPDLFTVLHRTHEDTLSTIEVLHDKSTKHFITSDFDPFDFISRSKKLLFLI